MEPGQKTAELRTLKWPHCGKCDKTTPLLNAAGLCPDCASGKAKVIPPKQQVDSADFVEAGFTEGDANILIHILSDQGCTAEVLAGALERPLQSLQHSLTLLAKQGAVEIHMDYSGHGRAQRKFYVNLPSIIKRLLVRSDQLKNAATLLQQRQA